MWLWLSGLSIDFSPISCTMVEYGCNIPGNMNNALYSHFLVGRFSRDQLCTNNQLIQNSHLALSNSDVVETGLYCSLMYQYTQCGRDTGGKLCTGTCASGGTHPSSNAPTDPKLVSFLLLHVYSTSITPPLLDRLHA